MGQEVEGDNLGDEFKGYVFKITGGNDKDGFSMKQGVLVQGRVRLLMKAGHKCYRPRRAGEKKRKSVRGCIVGADLAVIALAIAKIGEQPIAGLTDVKQPKRLGPKRATRIRKLFALTKEDDVRRFVIRRKIEKEGKPIRYKAPKIQRLVTDARLRRKRVYKAGKKARWERTRQAVADYQKVLEEFRKKKAAQHKEEIAAKKEQAHAAHVKKEEKNTPTLPAGKKVAPTKTVAATKDTKAAPQKAAGKTAAPATGKDTKVAAKDTKAAPAKTVAATKDTKDTKAAATQPAKTQAATKGKK